METQDYGTVKKQ